ncbi:hypothetical protein GW17_00038700 [Ensete ventricosum]|nr:hypothetical protein GW17_00038700 [Ensete ventricosum]
MVDRLHLWPPSSILLPPSAQELREQIRGVSQQRSIVWIPLERRTLDLIYPLHSDMEIQGYMISIGSEEEGRPATTSPHAWPATYGQAAARASPQGRPMLLVGVAARRVTPVGTASCGQPVRVATAHGHTRLQHDTRKGLSPMAGWLPAGKGSCRLCKGSSDDCSGADGARGVRASF